MKNLRHQFITHKIKAVCVLFLFLIPKKSLSQDSTYINDYRELNFGVSFNDWMPFPGFSYLRGQTIHFNNFLFVDMQMGFAFPSLATAKLGVGISPLKNNEVSIIFGVRPYPLAKNLNNFHPNNLLLNRRCISWTLGLHSFIKNPSYHCRSR